MRCGTDLRRQIESWQTAGTPAAARQVLSAFETWAASEEVPLDRALAGELLDLTGEPRWLSSLDDPARERWAEAVFRVIRTASLTLGDLFARRVAAHPTKTLLQDMGTAVPVQWSYEQIERRLRQLAAQLFLLSPSGAPRVAIFSENEVDSAVADLACLCFDILDAPLNTHFSADNLVEVFDALAIELVVVDHSERALLLEEVRARTRLPFRILTLHRSTAPENDHTLFLPEACAQLSAEEVERTLAARRRLALSEVATVMFTSGSTGRPKGVSFSIYQLVAKRYARAAALPEVGHDEVFLGFLPLYHTFGRYLELLGTIYWGGTYVLAGSTSVSTLFSLLPRINPTGFISVPVRWAQIHERCLERLDAAGPGADAASIIRGVVGTRLRWGLSAAGYLDPRVFRFFERNGIKVASGFGMTEGTGGITMTPPGRYVEDTHGPPLPGLRARLGEGGELQISGHYVARYLEDKGPGDLIPYPDSPERDYWLPTGDVFARLDSGYYQIVDRIKDIYKNNRGQTIAPLKVESKFTGVPGFRRTFLVGDGRPHNVLFIVPDRDDHVLEAALSEENERAYYRRIVSAVNADLAPYERVVGFELLERDFDPARGELTAKGSYNRQAIGRNFAETIERLYLPSFVEHATGGLRVRIPLWFYRDLGILEDAILVDDEGLFDQTRGLRLPCRAGDEPGSVVIGELEYQVRESSVDLGLFARQPRLWVGNPSLVRFSPCKEGWDVPLEAVSDHVVLPARRRELCAADEVVEGTGSPHLKQIHSLVARAFFGEPSSAAAALDELERIFAEPELRTSSVIRRRLEAMARHPEERVRCAAYRILLLDDPNPDYSRALSEFVHSHLSFLNQESIERIASSRLGEGRFDALRQRMLAYREQLDWPVEELARLQFEHIFRLFVDFGRYHPEFRGSVRAELASWALHQADPSLASKAEQSLEELDRAGEAKRTGPSEPGAQDWSVRLTFDEGIDPEEGAAIQAVLATRSFLEESLTLACDVERFELGAVPPGGIWISRLLAPGQARAYGVNVRVAGAHHRLRLVLDETLGSSEQRETVRWHQAIATTPYGRRVLPRVGSYRPELHALALAWPGGTDLWSKLGQLDAVRGTDGPPAPPGLLRRLFIEGMSVFFDGWLYSSRRIVPGVPSPANVIVAELDYRGDAQIGSLYGWRPYDGPLSLIRPMVTGFYLKTVAHYPWCQDELDLEWIFEACYEALGPGTLELMRELADELAGAPIEGPSGTSLGTVLDAYRSYLESNYVVPLAALNAIGRYKGWEVEHPLATAPEREASVLELRRLYRLERYPQIVGYHLWRHTYFASADEATRAAFDRLLARMSAEPESSALQLIELSDLQAALRTEEDRLVFSHMVFPRLRSAQGLDIFRFGGGGARKLVVHSYVAHRNGAVYSLSETYNPVEIGQLYRLLFLENYPKQISEQDRHYVVKDGEERVVGGVCFRMFYPSVAYLDSMVVASSLKGGGIGTAVLDDFCGRMASGGVGIVLTHAYLAPFFLRRGFKVDKKWGALVRDLV